MKPTLSRTLTNMLKERGDYETFITELGKVVARSKAEKEAREAVTLERKLPRRKRADMDFSLF